MKTETETDLLNAFLAFMSDFKAEVKQSVTNEVLTSLNGQIQLNKIFYSLAEVSQMTSISRRALKGRIDRGTLSSVKDGNTILITNNELQLFIARIENSASRKKKRLTK